MFELKCVLSIAQYHFNVEIALNESENNVDDNCSDDRLKVLTFDQVKSDKRLGVFQNLMKNCQKFKR